MPWTVVQDLAPARSSPAKACCRPPVLSADAGSDTVGWSTPLLDCPLPHQPVIARSTCDEAIHALLRGTMDCFVAALLAMTGLIRALTRIAFYAIRSAWR